MTFKSHIIRTTMQPDPKPFLTNEQVLELATKLHGDQKRDDGTPYINHPKYVGELAVKMYEAYCIYVRGAKFDKDLKDIILQTGYLHDVIEDTSATAESLLEAGVRPMVVTNVKTLTRKDKQLYYTYISGVVNYRVSALVKLADLQHNMIGSTGNRLDRYLFARSEIVQAWTGTDDYGGEIPGLRLVGDFYINKNLVAGHGPALYEYDV